MLVEVGIGNMTLLLDEVGRAESREREGGIGEMGEEGGEERGGDEEETSQLAMDTVEQLLVSLPAVASYALPKHYTSLYQIRQARIFSLDGQF